MAQRERWSPWSSCLLGVESRRRGDDGLEAVVISVRGVALAHVLARVVIPSARDARRGYTRRNRILWEQHCWDEYAAKQLSARVLRGMVIVRRVAAREAR